MSVEFVDYQRHTGAISPDVSLSQAKVTKHMFYTSKMSLIPSFLARQPNPNLIKDFFNMVFGLNEPDRVTPGLLLDISDVTDIARYISTQHLKKPFRLTNDHYSAQDMDNELLQLEVMADGKKQFKSITYMENLHM